ncbi:hypothetical protein EDB86DRAFT_3246747 [Lactarius hatsudake]|nr:hypothetical protein EDB86DRAFT_3246747 [Lactarius hatsudake]
MSACLSGLLGPTMLPELCSRFSFLPIYVRTSGVPRADNAILTSLNDVGSHASLTDSDRATEITDHTTNRRMNHTSQRPIKHRGPLGPDHGGTTWTGSGGQQKRGIVAGNESEPMGAII